MERSTRVFRFTALNDVAFQCPTRRCAMGCPLYLTRGLAVIEPDGMGASQVEQLHEELNMSYWPSGLVAATVQQIRSLKRSSFVPALRTPCSCTEREQGSCMVSPLRCMPCTPKKQRQEEVKTGGS
eukprot:scaffold2859_cov349-Pavlova_lutheri.AAC.74